MLSTTTNKLATVLLMGLLLSVQIPSVVLAQSSKNKKQRTASNNTSGKSETVDQTLPTNSQSYRSPGYSSPMPELPGNSVTGGQATASAFSRNGQATAQSSIQLGGGQSSLGDGLQNTDSLGSPFSTTAQFPMVTGTNFANAGDGVAIERTQSFQNGKSFLKTIIKKDDKKVTIIENESDGIQVAIRDQNAKGDDAVKTYFAKSRQELEQSEPSVYEWVQKYGNQTSPSDFSGMNWPQFSDGGTMEGGGRIGMSNGISASSGASSGGMSMGRSSSSSSGSGPSVAHSSSTANLTNQRSSRNNQIAPNAQNAQQAMIAQLETALLETNDPTLKAMLQKMIDDLRK